MEMKESKLLSIIIIMLPILSMYRIPGVPSSLSVWGTVVVFLYLFIKILKKRTLFKNQYYLEFFPFFIYLIANIILTLDKNYAGEQIIGGIENALMYYLIIFGLKKRLDKKIVYRAYTIITIVAVSVLIIQYLSVTFSGKIISGHIQYFYITNTENVSNYFNIYTYRPNSIFSEPSHYVYWISPMIISLITSTLIKPSKQKMIYAIVLSASVFISGSTTGLVTMAIVWGYYLIVLFSKGKIPSYIFLIIAFGGFVILRMQKIQSFIFMMERTLLNGNAFASRFGYLESLGNILKGTVFECLFGLGNDVAVITGRYGWLPSVLLIYKSWGIVGGLIWLVGFVKFLYQSERINWLCLIVFVSLNISGNIIMGTFFPLYFIFIVNSQSEYVND